MVSGWWVGGSVVGGFNKTLKCYTEYRKIKTKWSSNVTAHQQLCLLRFLKSTLSNGEWLVLTYIETEAIIDKERNPFYDSWYIC